MAKTVSKESLTLDQNGPDYGAALAEIKNIMATDQKSRAINGTKNVNWSRIDDVRVDRGAARLMKSILMLETDNRTMTLRSLFGLLIAAKEEIDLPGDLVDMMHKAIPVGLHVETPGAVRPKARSVPVADKPSEKVVPLRQAKKEDAAPIVDDIGTPTPDAPATTDDADDGDDASDNGNAVDTTDADY